MRVRGPWHPSWIEHAAVLWGNGVSAPDILARLQQLFPGFDKSEGSFSNLRNRRTARFPRRTKEQRLLNAAKAMRGQVRR